MSKLVDPFSLVREACYHITSDVLDSRGHCAIRIRLSGSRKPWTTTFLGLIPEDWAFLGRFRWRVQRKHDHKSDPIM